MLYTGRVELDLEHSVEMLVAADRLGVPELRAKCEKFLADALQRAAEVAATSLELVVRTQASGYCSYTKQRDYIGRGTRFRRVGVVRILENGCVASAGRVGDQRPGIFSSSSLTS